MDRINELLLALKTDGKLEKMSTYKELIKLSIRERPQLVYTSFDKMHELFCEIIEFDPNIGRSVKSNYSEAMKYLFNHIRSSSDVEAFDKYKALYNNYNVYIDDNVVIAEINQVFGYVSWLKNDIPKGLEYLKRSLVSINETSSMAVPQRYTNIGYLYEDQGEYKLAKEYYIKGLKFAKVNNCDDALKFAYAALGRLNHRIGKYLLSIKYYENCLSISDSNDESINDISVKSNIAMSYYWLGKHEKALSILMGIKKKWVKQRDPELYFSIVSNIGSCYTSFDDFDEALKYYQEELVYVKKSNITSKFIGVYHNIGHCYWRLSNYSASVEMLELAMEYAMKGTNERDIMLINQTLGSVYFDMGELDTALDRFLIAEKISEEKADYMLQERIKHKIARCYKELGNLESAYSTLLEEIDIVKRSRDDIIKSDDETDASDVVTTGSRQLYIYQDSMTFLSKELIEEIGLPIIGRSKEIKEVIDKALLASKNNASVLITGESGTGKEAIARLIHYTSARTSNSFIEVNSAVFSASLAISSLFGHKKGSFTGATQDHIGLIQASNKGTLFFDEVGEMPLEIQAMLLRTIESKTIAKLGSSKNEKVDFRLITATNHNIQESTDRSEFRFDLFHRINTIEIHIPPLRERVSDIPLLVKYYLNYFSQELNINCPILTQDALQKLYCYTYPGNIRELKNIVHRLLLFKKNETIKEDDIILPDDIVSNTQESVINLNLESNERQLITIAMNQTNKVMTEAAKLLGISPYALARRIKKYKLEF